MDCSVFDLIGSEKWRNSTPLRDVIDLFIIVYISNTQRQDKSVNITSIADFLGISRATATRRIQHLIKHHMIVSKKSASSLILSLTSEGDKFVGSIWGQHACKSLQSIQFLTGSIPLIKNNAHETNQYDSIPNAEHLLADLSSFQKALGGHMSWLVQWYHKMLNRDKFDKYMEEDCGECSFDSLFSESNVSGIIHNYDKVVFDHAEIHRYARELWDRASDGQNIATPDLEGLIELIVTFATSAQQTEREIWQVIAMIDPLTGLGNRHLMLPRLRSEQIRSERQGQPCCVAIADIDHFKLVNDTLGHVQGDRILRLVAEQLQSATRPYDLLFRYGGEEFLICLPGTTMATAVQVLERIRVNISKMIVAEVQSLPIKLTCTFGITEMGPDLTAEEIITQADEALYDGKHKGRNKVSVYMPRK